MPVPVELHIDVRRVGGDAVVYEVGDGRLRVVPEGPQGLGEPNLSPPVWHVNRRAVVESSGSAAQWPDQAVRFPINSASDGEPGVCDRP